MTKQTARLELIAGKFSTRIEAGLLQSFKEIKSSVKLKQVEDAITRGGIARALGLLQTMDDVIDKNVIDDLTDAVKEGGRFAVGAVPDGGIAKGHVFNLLDPNTAQAVETHRTRLIRQVSTETKKAVAQSIRANIIAGNGPIKMARDFRDSIGLTTKQELAVRNYEKGLRELDAGVLTRALRDKRSDSLIRRAIDSAQPLDSAKVQSLVSRYRDRFIKHRAKVIARTEALRAVSMGEFESIRQAQAKGKIHPGLKRFWSPVPDEKLRNSHRQIPIMNEKGVFTEQPFQSPLGPILFPRDPNALPGNTIQCRCALQYKIDRSVKAPDGFVAETEKPKLPEKPPKPPKKQPPKKKKVKQPAAVAAPQAPTSVLDIGDQVDFSQESVRVMRETADRIIPTPDLSEAERDALNFYKTKNFDDINDPLRKGKLPPPDSPEMKALHGLDSAFDSAGVLKEDVMVYRGIESKKLFKFAKSRKFIDDKGFVSTSLSRTIAESFTGGEERTAVLFRIRLKKGTKVLYADRYSKRLQEGEILLRRDAKFKILKTKEIDIDGIPTRFYELEHVPPPEAISKIMKKGGSIIMKRKKNTADEGKKKKNILLPKNRVKRFIHRVTEDSPLYVTHEDGSVEVITE